MASGPQVAEEQLVAAAGIIQASYLPDLLSVTA
jgi:hypothetical protein